MDERKQFMKRIIFTHLLLLAQYDDPLKKREEFSVSLRKQRKAEIINNKRKRAFDYDVSLNEEESPQKNSNSMEREEIEMKELLD